MEVGALLAILISAIPALYWSVALGNILLLLPKMPKVGDALRLPAPARWPKLSVVIPAHNEERVIETCARSFLASDYPNLELLFVLDRCTDRTRELLRPLECDRLRVHENASCPADWAGKCNAASVGAGLVGGEYVLFTDADVEAAPTLLRAAMAMILERRRGLLSLLPTLTTHAWFEVVVQPAAVMGLLRLYPIDKVNRDRDRRPFANGQFLLFERAVYDAIGGHHAVKDDLLEDIAFARVVEQHGSRGMIALAERLLVVNMYGSLRAMREGWKRIYIEACKRKVERLRAHALRIGLLSVAAPIVQVAAAVLGLLAGGTTAVVALAVVGAGALAQFLSLWLVFGLSRAPRAGILAYPLGGAIVAKAFWDGAGDLLRRRPIRWGGREYILAPRD